MTRLDIRLFDANLADRTVLREYYELMVSCAADWSDEAPSEYDAAIERLRNPAPGLGPFVQWAAYLDDRLMGFEKIGFPEQENSHIGFVEIDIHPDVRRRGIGTEMLHCALPTLAARGRTEVEVWSVTEGSPAEKWAVRHGFERVHTTVLQRLLIDTVEPGLWDVDAPAGYHAVSWIGKAPEGLVASYARARGAMDDAPLEDSTYRSPRWTVERVRADEDERQRSKVELRVVAAVDDAGEVAGFTEVNIREYRTDLAFQGDTAVTDAHRGNGLGRFVKARMAAWLRTDFPGLRCVLTSTAAVNTQMIRVNGLIGYVTSRRTLVMNSGLSNLKTRLSGDR
jgi:GNAT superfamily N-acetyltransferase